MTLSTVERGRVVLRALLEVDPARMGKVYWDNPEDDALHWAEVFVERGAEVGTHEGGAPAVSVETLYDQCEGEILGADVDASPRLYFDANGLLMQCGFAPEDCSDCASISIQSLSGDQGPVLPGAFYAPALPLECQAPPPPPKALRPGEPPELADICRIDPKACPKLDEAGDRARLQESQPSLCSAMRGRTPSLLEVGKVDRLSTWSFPFSGSAGGECGNESRTYFLRIKPSIGATSPRSEWRRASD